jgi:hypothetical protein
MFQQVVYNPKGYRTICTPPVIMMCRLRGKLPSEVNCAKVSLAVTCPWLVFLDVRCYCIAESAPVRAGASGM